MGLDHQVPGDLLDRCSVVLRTFDGRFLGTGTLVAPSWVLTCHHVVESSTAVEVAATLRGERLSWAVVSRREPDQDLAVLNLKASLEVLGRIDFVEGNRGESFYVAGWGSSGRLQVSGHVQGISTDHSPWVQIEAQSTDLVQKGCSGAPVWVEDRKAAVGIVTHYGEGRKAYMIPTSALADILSDVGDDDWASEAVEDSAEDLANLGPSRFVQFLDPAHGDQLLGQGVRLDRDHILTLRTIAGPRKRCDVLEAGQVEKRQSVLQPTERETYGDLGFHLVVATSLSEPSATFDFAAQKRIPGRSRCCSVAFTCSGGSWVRHVRRGYIFGYNAGTYSVTFSEPIADPFVDMWCGAGVFAEVLPGVWKLAGLLKRIRAANGLEVLAIHELLEKPRFVEVVRSRASSDDFEPSIDPIVDLLDRSDVARVIARGQPEWERALRAENPVDTLARKLVFESEPLDLAKRLERLHERTLDTGLGDTANSIFQILMLALPVAFRMNIESHWPDDSARRLRFDLVFEELVEIALAADDGGPALFKSHEIDSHGELHSQVRLSRAGDYGPDLGGLHEAADLVDDMTQRIALDPPTSVAERDAIDLVARLAVQKGWSGVPIFSKRDLYALDQAIGTPEERRFEILKAINNHASQPVRLGRRLYYSYRSDDEHGQDREVALALQGLVPGLRLVGYSTRRDGFAEFLGIVSAIRRAFTRHSRR